MASSDKIKAGEAYIEANLEDATFRNKLKRMQLYFTRTFPRATKTAEKAVRAFGATVATVATAATRAAPPSNAIWRPSSSTSTATSPAPADC